MIGRTKLPYPATILFKHMTPKVTQLHKNNAFIHMLAYMTIRFYLIN